MLQISPTATSPEVSGLDDNDQVFRVVPSDDYQGLVLARLYRRHEEEAED